MKPLSILMQICKILFILKVSLVLSLFNFGDEWVKKVIQLGKKISGSNFLR